MKVIAEMAHLDPTETHVHDLTISHPYCNKRINYENSNFGFEVNAGISGSRYVA
jgi:hypothetical protein